MRRRLADVLWRRRSWKGRTAVIIGATLAFLLIIGLAFPAEEESKEGASPPVATDEPTTTSGNTTTEEATTQAEPPPPPPPPHVARLIDGDTLELDNGERVRLVQIDAPERKGECYGRQAATVLRKLLPVGVEVRILRDRRLDNVDKDGRLLRYVFRGRKNINLLLVQKGAASVWFFNGDRGRYAAKLTRAADQARNQGRGAWSACEASYDFSRAWTVRRKPPPEPAPATPVSNCHPSYEGACLDPNSSDYDCAGGEGNGPDYTGTVRVVGPDDYGLDADGDGVGCEDS
jgi:endonuclease YncB( thermonuclease family)